jgi:O-methyltransferase
MRVAPPGFDAVVTLGLTAPRLMSNILCTDGPILGNAASVVELRRSKGNRSAWSAQAARDTPRYGNFGRTRHRRRGEVAMGSGRGGQTTSGTEPAGKNPGSPYHLRHYLLQSLPSRHRHALQCLFDSYGPVRNPQDFLSMLRFLKTRSFSLPFHVRVSLLARFLSTPFQVKSFHTHSELLQIVTDILSFPGSSKGCIVEAGCFKGGSTIKLSIAAKLTNRRLFVFDSFSGLPDNVEQHDKTIFGNKINFCEGKYSGSIEEVKTNVEQFGEFDACTFVKGWFEQTMIDFRESVAVAFLDVDLASSTRTCLKHLYPLLIPGGVIYSQDGHIPLVIAVLDDENFWNYEVGVTKPRIEGLHERKLVRIMHDS